MKVRTVVAMSGGVDSSVAAALLKKQGYEVIGVTMCFNLPDFTKKRQSCCSPESIEDARRVAHKLGIRHYVVNMQEALEEHVIKDFCQEYLEGRTPNPCVRCNQYIKFGALLKKAYVLQAQYLATGHYARIVKNRNFKLKICGYFLKKARDKMKDQSYFLYRISQRELKHILFPLGSYTKEEVRRLAREFDLPVAHRLSSQEICFLDEVDYRGFFKAHFKEDIKVGLIVDKQGAVLGEHKGIPFYTIGQREGLGIAKGYPLYITNIDYKNNLIVVGTRDDVLKSEFLVKGVHFIAKPIKNKVVVKVRIRYNHKEAQAEISSFDSRVKVKFIKPQFAITPGQSAVFYSKDIVLGGGIIERVLK